MGKTVGSLNKELPTLPHKIFLATPTFQYQIIGSNHWQMMTAHQILLIMIQYSENQELIGVMMMILSCKISINRMIKMHLLPTIVVKHL